jgi:F-type H+-transporting ATPase subunit epsilon
MAKTFACTLVTPEASVLDTQATYADLPAHDGQMGVLPDRGAMLVKLGVGQCVINTEDGQTHRFVLDGGFAQMDSNKLSLLCERAYPASDITAEQAREAMTAAQALPKSNVEEVQKRDHDLAVARSMNAVAS